MTIRETVRRSTWHRRPLGRRLMSDNPPYFSISQSDGTGETDALRRKTLARVAHLES